MSTRYQFTYAGIDVTEWVRSFPGLQLRKSELGQLIQLPDISIEMDNTKQIWTPGHPNTILDELWQGEPILIHQDDILIYEGEINNVAISLQGRVATVSVGAKVNRVLGTQIFFFESTQKTFAEISEALYLQFGVTTDATSYQIVREKQEDLLFQSTANINLNTNYSLLQAQQWLMDAGMCRHYFIGNTAYIKMLDPNETNLSLHTFVDSEILDVMDYTLIDRQHYDGYEVITAIGTARVVGVNPAPQLDAGVQNPFTISTLGFGFNWGDNQIDWSTGDKYRIQIHLAAGDFSSWINLETYFRIESERMGINRTFETISIDESSLLGPIIEAESV